MLIIPLTTDPDRRLQVQLGSLLLDLRTYFAPGVPGWFLDIADTEGVPLATGLALVPQVNVLEASPELTRTLGQFRVLAFEQNSENRTDAAIDPLWWFAPGEWESLETPRAAGADLPFDVGATYSPIPGVPPAEVPLVIQQLQEVTERLYHLVNTDLYPRLS